MLGTTYEMMWDHTFEQDNMRGACYVQAIYPISEGSLRREFLVGVRPNDSHIRFISDIPQTNGATWDHIDKIFDLGNELVDEFLDLKKKEIDDLIGYGIINDLIKREIINDDDYFTENELFNMFDAVEFIRDVKSIVDHQFADFR